MRLRNVKNASEQLAFHPDWMILDPENHQGKWKILFGNDHPLYLEIGCGKGRFLMEMARAHPNLNFLGIEKFDSVILRALQKVLSEPLPNIRLIRADAVDLEKMFLLGEIERIYLHFSDPWPKPSHARRRLTSPQYLERYQKVMKPGFHVIFKTDNFPLFAFSMKSIVDAGWKIPRISLDLHAETDIPNLDTEFESRFVALGKPIFYIETIVKE